MPIPNQAALEFLQTRRSRPAKTLTTPVPDPDALRALLTIAARTPDHKKLEPWRFIVLEKPALERLAALIPARAAALDIAPEAAEKMVRQFADADLAVAVIGTPKPRDDVPEIEQVLSAGAACYGLLAAALAAGWGANWLTGWAVYDRPFVEQGLGLQPQEFVAGFIHIGSEKARPPERPRPDVDAITEWVRE
ncbi:nitroreductase family protein [Tropicimonas isoalkanivorans]|uniref:Putative NAD(P)H nitroreductase n=1 Tax=Tropicimonas isoalkanivorans TaxID=441112 RepID=A0A1I1EBF6_9RHOB|nr:nitroreductase family protein [Tropicimonas isoalkanivorans]SFB84066.1 Nitroreductase [Tropicimonas isoalkanivorans]